MPSETQRLLFRGRVLEPFKTLAEEGKEDPGKPLVATSLPRGPNRSPPSPPPAQASCPAARFTLWKSRCVCAPGRVPVPLFHVPSAHAAPLPCCRYTQPGAQDAPTATNTTTTSSSASHSDGSAAPPFSFPPNLGENMQNLMQGVMPQLINGIQQVRHRLGGGAPVAPRGFSPPVCVSPVARFTFVSASLPTLTSCSPCTTAATQATRGAFSQQPQQQQQQQRGATPSQAAATVQNAAAQPPFARHTHSGIRGASPPLPFSLAFTFFFSFCRLCW